jgi:hypothetical protein
MPSTGPIASSLVVRTLWRAVYSGRAYLILSTFLTVLFATVIILGDKKSFETVFPLEVPLFSAFGTTGAILVFVSDRSKGVFEYLVAYGVKPRNLFVYGLTATVGLGAMMLAVTIAAGFCAFAALGQSISWLLIRPVLEYTVPMTFASSLFASMCGMIWSSVSSPIAGIDAPVGVTPLIGMAPSITVLILALTMRPENFFYVTGAFAASLLAVVGAMLYGSGRWMRRERLLSAA